MAAAATASRLSTAPEPRGAGVLAAIGIVVAGGLVEGAAIGTAQAWLLGAGLPRLRRRRFVAVTVLVAGVGWAGGSLPGVLAGDDPGAAPPVALTVLAGAGLGVGMGLLLGLAQAAVLRRAAPGWRWWPAASTLAWTPAMALVFAGASVPGAGWPLAAVTATGALTGAVAGAVLGLVLGALAPRLDSPGPR